MLTRTALVPGAPLVADYRLPLRNGPVSGAPRLPVYGQNDLELVRIAISKDRRSWGPYRRSRGDATGSRGLFWIGGWCMVIFELTRIAPDDPRTLGFGGRLFLGPKGSSLGRGGDSGPQAQAHNQESRQASV